MKTYFCKIFVFLLALFMVLSPIALASNIEPREGGEAVVTSENGEIQESFETNYEIVYSDLYLYNTNLEISQIVDGNVFAYGQNVNVTGVIRGNLFVMANELTISDEAIIQGSVFALANNINASGEISDIYAMSSNFTMNENGLINRNAYLIANSISLSGQITRDAYLSVQNLSFGENAKQVIGGNLNYNSNNEIELDDGIVGGEVNFTKIEEQEVSAGDIAWSIASSIISSLVFAMGIILITTWFAPEFKNKTAEILASKSLKAFGTGLLVLFGGILAAIIIALFTYGFGLGIGLFIAALIALAYIASGTIFSIAVGSLIAQKLENKKSNNSKNEKTGKGEYGMYILFALLITFALNLVEYIPFVGSPIKFIASIIGLGILILNLYKRK